LTFPRHLGRVHRLPRRDASDAIAPPDCVVRRPLRRWPSLLRVPGSETGDLLTSSTQLPLRDADLVLLDDIPRPARVTARTSPASLSSLTNIWTARSLAPTARAISGLPRRPSMALNMARLASVRRISSFSRICTSRSSRTVSNASLRSIDRNNRTASSSTSAHRLLVLERLAWRDPLERHYDHRHDESLEHQRLSEWVRMAPGDGGQRLPVTEHHQRGSLGPLGVYVAT